MKTLLFKPFEKYSDKTLLIAGVLLTLIGSILGYWLNARFDGVLDLHFVKNVPLKIPFLDNLLNIFSLVLFLFFLAKYLNKKIRFIDILAMAMIARTPIYLLSLSNYNSYLSKITDKLLVYTAPEKYGQIPPIDILSIMLLFSIISILIFIWYIALLYNGFKTASHAKGIKASVLFGIAILLAEILSKILIYNFY